jgi:hypothetical protein
MVELEISRGFFGIKRKVVFEGIAWMSMKNKEAVIKWIVQNLNEDNSLINDIDIVSERIVETRISDQNKVTSKGILIIPENFESEEDYQEALEIGIPEYTFWMTAIQNTPLPAIIMQAAHILDQFNRFDRA